MTWKSIKEKISTFISDMFRDSGKNGERTEKYSSTKTINWLFVVFTLAHIGVSLKIMYVNKTIDHVLLAELLTFVAGIMGIKGYVSVQNGKNGNSKPKKELLID
ncbi:hypothetical protein COB55_06040 [Candidatus Wolfebacteria bacterium]|nr:MAG: hypothetical protein COB55_06040 [Candidatus Wolfebacteria bacterium]